MSLRRTVTFDDDLVEKIDEFSRKWKVNASEVMRRCFALGVFFAEDLSNKKAIFRKDENGELVKLEFPGTIPFS